MSVKSFVVNSLCTVVVLISAFFSGMLYERNYSRISQSQSTTTLVEAEAQALRLKLENPLMVDSLSIWPQGRVSTVPPIDRADLEIHVRNPLQVTSLGDMLAEIEAMKHNGGLMGPKTKQFIIEALAHTATAPAATQPSTLPSN